MIDSETSAPLEMAKELDESKRPMAGQVVRWVTLALILAGFAAALFSDWFHSCTMTLTSNGSGQLIEKTEVCAPAGVNAPLVVVVVLTAILLLWPDLASFTVLGISLTKKVEQVKHGAERAQRSADAAIQSIQTISARIDNVVTASASAGASATVHNNFYGGRSTSWPFQESQRLQEASVGFDVIQFQPPAQPLDYDQLVGELIRRWASLAKYLDIERHIPGSKQKPEPERSPHAQARYAFVQDYSEQLHLLRRLRNAVAHGAEAPIEDIQTGVQLLIELAERAEDWMRRRNR